EGHLDPVHRRGGRNHSHSHRWRFTTVKWNPSLAARVALFSFAPACVVLICSFVALNAVVGRQVKSGIRESLLKSEQLLERADEDASRRVTQLLPVLTQSPSFQAAIGLLRETHSFPGSADQVRQTIEAQLREIHDLVGYDLLAVTNWKG